MAEKPRPIRSSSQSTVRIALATGLILLALWIASDFLVALGWGAIIALATWPAYRKFAAKLSSRHSTVLAPLSFTFAIGVMLFVPLMLAIHQAAEEIQALVQSLAHIRQNGLPPPSWLAAMPFGDQAVRWWSANFTDPRVVTEWFGSDVNKQSDVALTRALFAQFLHRLFLFFLALVTLFVLLRNGAWIGRRVLETADKLVGDPGERYVGKMADAVRGTVNGTVVVAAGEGAIIGMAYVVAGVPSPLLFALLTAAFAMMPLGAWAVFTAASLLLLQDGHAAAAAGVFSFGAIVMIIGDTVVWPSLVGKNARLPFLAALVGIFGGLQTFGLIGLVLGPMILAALWAVWKEWLGSPNVRTT